MVVNVPGFKSTHPMGQLRYNWEVSYTALFEDRSEHYELIP